MRRYTVGRRCYRAPPEVFIEETPYGDLRYPSERMASLVQLIKCWTAAVTVCAVTRKGGSEDCVGKLWARYVTERWGRGTVRRGKRGAVCSVVDRGVTN